MGLKDLFFVNEETDNKTPEPKQETKVNVSLNKFPTSQETPSFPPSNTPSNTPSFGQANDEQINKILEMYQSGFNSLNQPGYDFFEFYQAIMTSGGVDNPQMYVMAMSMGSAMEPSNTKEKLISQADYYLNEINKVYDSYVNTGSSKRNTLIQQKESENRTLNDELSNLRSQLEAITNQIKSKENQLSLIDNKYQPQINEVDSKLKANDIAKDRIVSNIVKVKNGINNNIK